MSLIKSISGIRGTIGGFEGQNLTPPDIIKYTASYTSFIQKQANKTAVKIVVARDARISGPMVEQFISATLVSMGAKPLLLGLCTTPTTEIAVTQLKADGGIIITASHNPKHWNAMKLLNSEGEFLNAAQGEEILDLAENRFGEISFAQTDSLYPPEVVGGMLDKHIELILQNKYVDQAAIKIANFSVAIDGINSVGGPAMRELLKALGVNKIHEINCEPTGNFSHSPEPVPENLTDIAEYIAKNNVDVGFVSDPDCDRLAIISEDGTMFGEEYTLAAVADYILSVSAGNTVSNLSSSRVLRDITLRHGGEYTAAAVGEVNVVAEMKRKHAIIGGEGNGGVILPDLHYGRDTLIGIALFLTFLAKTGKKCTQIKASYPNYYIIKNKIELTPETDIDEILLKIKNEFSSKKDVKITDIDGIKLDFDDGWVHLRKSNTEPIIRVYAESKSIDRAEKLAKIIMESV